MRTFNTREAKDKFGSLLDTAQHEPVTIEEEGKIVAIMLSPEEYSRLEEAEDVLWLMRVKEAEKEGFLSSEESEKFLKEIRNAKD